MKYTFDLDKCPDVKMFIQPELYLSYWKVLVLPGCPENLRKGPFLWHFQYFLFPVGVAKQQEQTSLKNVVVSALGSDWGLQVQKQYNNDNSFLQVSFKPLVRFDSDLDQM